MNSLTEAQKAARANQIAETAWHLFETQPFAKITMAEVAKTAGVSKGTLFNYFDCKESLFMTLLLTGYQEYFNDVIQMIQAKASLTLADFIDLLLHQTKVLIETRPTLVRLNALRGPVLEQGANMEQTVAFREQLYAKNQALGQAVAERIPSLTVKEVSQLMLVQSAIISGLMNMSSLNAFNHHLLTKVNFENFQIDLVNDAVDVFGNYLAGRYPETHKR
jgi:AcrR family transcriptional regulator